MAQEHYRSRRRGRPAAPILNRERIADAAIGLATEHSYRSLTMAGLAKRLGVSTSALYNHVASKHEVLVLIQEQLNATIDCSGFGTQPWDEALRMWAHSYRRRFIEHTDLIPMVAVFPVADAPRTLQMYEDVASGLCAAGVPETDVVDIIVGVESLIFGAAYDASAPVGLFDPGQSAELAPTFSQLAAQRPQDSRAAADQAFQKALDALITGLSHRLPSTAD